MQKSLVRKGLILGIIFLFIGVSIVPGISSNVREAKKFEVKKESAELQNRGDPVIIYVDTSGIDRMTRLNATERAQLKSALLAHIWANFNETVGAENVTVTNDSNQEENANRTINIIERTGATHWVRPGGGSWIEFYYGRWRHGRSEVEVYLRNFVRRHADDYKDDGVWNITRLANAIGRTAAHEVAHSYCVGHNHRTGENVSKMTDGELVNSTTRGRHEWHFDNHTRDVLRRNWGNPPCDSAVDYDMDALTMNYWGPPTIPEDTCEFASTDAIFSYFGELASLFEFGWLGEDTDDGIYDGNSYFDFIYKSSMSYNPDQDAEMITFLKGHSEQVQFLLRGSLGSPWDGQWFPLDRDNAVLSDFITDPNGKQIARNIAMMWDVDNDGTTDVTVNLDSLSYGSMSNPYNGFTYEQVFPNTLPNAPNKPDGPTYGQPGTEYTFSFSADDPDGDQVIYYVDWDDDSDGMWFGPYDSGDIVTASHIWEEIGTFAVKVKCMDIHFAESDWSEPLSVFALEGFFLNLADFPMYIAENIDGYTINQMCGPAVAQMSLDYMWWNTSSDPFDPPTWCNDSGWNQIILFNRGLENNSNSSLTHLDATGLRYMIQNLDPPYADYGYNFAVYHDADSTTMLEKICLWINYTAGIKPGHPVHVPSAVPAYGDYSNWLSVRGIHTDVPAYPLPESLEIRGFWVNDPYPSTQGDIGENSYKMVYQWLDAYYLRLNVEDDPYNGSFIAICEPPPSVDCDITLKESTEFWSLQPPSRKGGSSFLSQVFDHLIIHAAREGVKEQLIPCDDDFAEIFEQTYPGRPILIKNLVEDKHDYYAVPFNNIQTRQWIPRGSHAPPQEDITLVVVLVDATNGQFKETSWVHEPTNYLPLSKTDALDIVFDELIDLGYNSDELNMRMIDTDFVYRDSSPFYPEWRVIIDEIGMEFFIGQDGTVTY